MDSRTGSGMKELYLFWTVVNIINTVFPFKVVRNIYTG